MILRTEHCVCVVSARTSIPEAFQPRDISARYSVEFPRQEKMIPFIALRFWDKRTISHRRDFLATTWIYAFQALTCMLLPVILFLAWPRQCFARLVAQAAGLVDELACWGCAVLLALLHDLQPCDPPASYHAHASFLVLTRFQGQYKLTTILGFICKTY